MMYEKHLYLPWFIRGEKMTLEEVINKQSRKGHIIYARTYHVSSDGYYNEWHENPDFDPHTRNKRRLDRKYMEYKLRDEIGSLVGYPYICDGIRAFINDDHDEYIVIKQVKRGSRLEDALRKIGFTVIKVAHD